MNKDFASRSVPSYITSEAVSYPITWAKNPTHNILISEVYKSWLGNDYAYFNNSYGQGNIPHNDGGNFLYVDSHAEYINYANDVPGPFNNYSDSQYISFWRGGK